MQFQWRFAYIALCCTLSLSSVILLMSVWAQAPEKAQIAFTSDRDGNWEIYIMDSDGRNQLRLTNNDWFDGYPAWFDPAFAHAVFPAGKLKETWGWLKQTSR